MSSRDNNALPYAEPDISTILILASLLLVLNIVNHVLDKLIFCGLLGQVFLGIAWGTPGAKWLSKGTEEVIVNIGYLGLILLVFEGGLSTNFRSLKANLALSAGVALTGIALPIGLSYILLHLCDATPLQAFAAGAALCSTSLGTTFTVLGTSDLVNTRMGIVLTSAAMMDDVVGLVMVQVISELGNGSESFSAVTVIRPVFVSIAFAVVVPLVALFLVKPLTCLIKQYRSAYQSTRLERIITTVEFAFLVHTGVLLGMVAGSSYAGTSNLFASYLAGAAISWWDTEVSHVLSDKTTQGQHSHTSNLDAASSSITIDQIHVPSHDNLISISPNLASGQVVFNQYYGAALRQVLKPFFFASIGFSIPISQLFSGSVVWKGVIYALVMFVGKLTCGLWLIRLPTTIALQAMPWKSRVLEAETQSASVQETKQLAEYADLQSPRAEHSKQRETQIDDWDIVPDSPSNIGETNNAITQDLAQLPTANLMKPHEHISKADCKDSLKEGAVDGLRNSNHAAKDQKEDQKETSSHHQPASNPLSLYPSLILGTAMTARGEIGFLISSVAQSNGIFSTTSDATTSASTNTPALFLIVTWAVMLCTIFGPICVGLLVQKVRRLEQKAKKIGNGREKDVLGAWGVS